MTEEEDASGGRGAKHPGPLEWEKGKRGGAVLGLSGGEATEAAGPRTLSKGKVSNFRTKGRLP